LVKKAILLGVALCAVVSLANAATATTKKKTAKNRPHTVSAPAKTTAKTTTAKTTPKSRTAASKTTKGKKTVRKASAPRQLAPTKDRYQQIQQALASKGYYSGEPNGAWGSDSVEALKRFQADQNLTPDGKLGSLSLIALGLGPKRLSAQSAAQPARAAPQQ
jgi:peptidoglycan hydrolase-like protein with peptidoglycan-binding domain